MRISLSYSTYSELMKCPQRVAFKRAGAKGPLSASLLYGQVLHLGLREMYKLETEANVSDYINLVLDAYSKGRVPEGERAQENWDGTLLFTKNDPPLDVMRTWIPSTISKYQARYPEVPGLHEVALTRAYEDFDLVGIIDAVRDGRAIDYKLGNERYKPDPLQAAFYALLLRGPSRFEFHVFRKRAVPDLPEIFVMPEANNPAYLEYVEKMILPGAANMLRLETLPANPSNFLCDERYCTYWAQCLGRILGSRAQVAGG